MKRRTFLRNTGFALASLGLGRLDRLAQAGQASSRPNIIVIMTDDQGWGDLSCYPQDPRFPDARLRTPNIDSMAAEGVRCTQGYATCNVCAPTRAGLLTGRYQQRFGFYAFEECLAGLPQDEMTLAECLKPMGYSTAIIGKWHVGYRLSPLTRGFDRFYGFQGGQHDFFDPRLGDPTQGFSFDLYDADILDQNKPVESMEYLTHEQTKHSLRFIEESVKNKQPFFLYLPYHAPHPPLQTTWENLEKWAQARGGRYTSRDIVRAMLECVDKGVGQILDKLMHLGIDNNTLIIYTSDNGGHDDSAEFNDSAGMVQHNGGLRGRKGFFYEGGIRVPFIVRWPGQVPEGVVYENPVSHLDIFATAVAISGAKPPSKPLDGVNLIPYLQGHAPDRPHETLYWGFHQSANRWAVRQGDWKLTMEIEGARAAREQRLESVLGLVNLAEDPSEQNNLKEARPDKVKELMAIRDAFYEKLPPSICTPEMLEENRKEIEKRRARLKDIHNIDHENHLRRDGAPGHGF